MEDRPLNVLDYDRTVLDTGRNTGGKTPIDGVLLIINSDFYFRAEVLDIIVV